MEIGSASYFMMMLLTICMAVAGIFGPHSIERSSNSLSPDLLNKLHCRIFGNCIFFGGIFLLGGLLDFIGVVGMVVAGEVLFFGAMYFVGLLANESDKARVARERAREEQARARAEQERVLEEQERAWLEQERLEAERVAAALEATRLEIQRRYEHFCELALAGYLHNVDQSLRFFNVLLDDEDLEYDEEFMREFELDCLSPQETLHWRIGVLFSYQNPQLESSQAYLLFARELAKRYVDKHFVGVGREK